MEMETGNERSGSAHSQFPFALRIPNSRVARWAVCLACAASTVAAAPPATRREAPASASAIQAQHEAQWRQRRDRRRAILAALWGSVSADPAAIAEFGLHAWRMARLRRVERLATELARPALLERVGKLMAKEQARHTKHLRRLKDQLAPSTAPPVQHPKTSTTPRRPARQD